jgi:hypothetical protein
MKSLAFTILIGCVVLIGALVPGARAGPPWGMSAMSPEEETDTGLSYTEDRVQDYVSKEHHLPAKLSDLPLNPGKDGRLTDGWGKPFLYAPQKDGSVILSSVGRDGPDHAESIRFSMIDPSDDVNDGAKLETYEDLKGIEYRMHDYVAACHHLPETLTDLDSADSTARLSTVDGWGDPISYARQSDGSVLLSSHGKPGCKQVFSRQFTVPGATPGAPTTSAATSPK